MSQGRTFGRLKDAAATAFAAGERLPFKQSAIAHRGAAIECRINAEDPECQFQPSPGRIERMFSPGGMGVRFDSHAHPGYSVPPHYDSLIGKLIVHQPTRAEAIACMLRALDELRIEGIRRQRADGHAERAQCLAGELFIDP